MIGHFLIFQRWVAVSTCSRKKRLASACPVGGANERGFHANQTVLARECGETPTRVYPRAFGRLRERWSYYWRCLFCDASDGKLQQGIAPHAMHIGAYQNRASRAFGRPRETLSYYWRCLFCDGSDGKLQTRHSSTRGAYRCISNRETPRLK
jgi:hypothetical protein